MFVLIGAGGHCKVVLDILSAANEEVLGLIDDGIQDKNLHDCPLLGKIRDIPELLIDLPSALFLITIGNNKTRYQVAQTLKNLPITYGTAIHPTAILGKNAKIGNGTVIMPYAVVHAESEIGEHRIINTHAVVEHDCKVNSFAHISPQAALTGNVQGGNVIHRQVLPPLSYLESSLATGQLSGQGLLSFVLSLLSRQP